MDSCKRICALVPAGGQGKRMMSVVPKLLLKVGQCSVIQQAINRISQSQLVGKIVVVVPSQSADSYRNLNFGGLESGITFGGETRQESVRNGLEYLASMGQWDYVVIHDGARPFVEPSLIDRVLQAAIGCGAATAALPISDSVRQVDNVSGKSTSLNRSEIWSVQTPQAFRFDLILGAHRRFSSTESKLSITDDISMVEDISEIKFVLGSKDNIKVTFPEDLNNF